MGCGGVRERDGLRERELGWGRERERYKYGVGEREIRGGG